jgi:hypothetical protein
MATRFSALTPRAGRVLSLAAALILAPAVASAQYSAPRMTTEALGERYHFEISGTLWNPALFGVISSEQFGLIGSNIDFVGDLGFEKTRFKDLRIVLRPGKKSKFRIQYTPVQYTAASTLRREIVFNGQRFPVSVPVESEFAWKVWRVGYEYDFIYKPRGYVGFLLEARATEMTAELTTASPLLQTQLSEFTQARAPLPAIGVVGRAYVVPEVAVNFEVSGFRLPDIDPKYQANYFDWDLSGTVNLTNYVGVQVGWRRMSTFLAVESDQGDLKFQGMWFGAAIRY